MIKTFSSKAGFTLIELVVIIVIVAILAATALPKFLYLRTDAKNSADNGTIRTLKAVALTLYLKSQAEGDPNWPTGNEIADNVPNLEMTTDFEPNKWCYKDNGDTVVFYCDHGTEANANGRRWWTYYRVDSGSYKAGQFIEGSSEH